MNKAISQTFLLVAALAFAISCQNGSIDHIGGTRLVILQPIPMVENTFDEDFKAMLELLYPIECHDTVFIQDRIFLERIDLAVPFKKEFVIPSSMLRDFFGSNNPDKKRALREELFYGGDTCFEMKPDRQLSVESQISRAKRPLTIGHYLSRNRKNTLVYLVSADTLCKNYKTGGFTREVHNDYAKLNCRIVSDLRQKTREELMNTTVILVLIPAENDDSTGIALTIDSAANRNASASGIKPPVASQARMPVEGSRRCPADSVVIKINRKRQAVISEFRNLLHYIATTVDDADLKRKYREDAFAEMHKIPNVKIEGIPGNDLREFLNSGFSRNVAVSPVVDKCGVIAGVGINY